MRQRWGWEMERGSFFEEIHLIHPHICLCQRQHLQLHVLLHKMRTGIYLSQLHIRIQIQIQAHLQLQLHMQMQPYPRPHQHLHPRPPPRHPAKRYSLEQQSTLTARQCRSYQTINLNTFSCLTAQSSHSSSFGLSRMLSLENRILVRIKVLVGIWRRESCKRRLRGVRGDLSLWGLSGNYTLSYL